MSEPSRPTANMGAKRVPPPAPPRIGARTAGRRSARRDITPIICAHFAKVFERRTGILPLLTDGEKLIVLPPNTDPEIHSLIKSLPARLGSGWASGSVSGGGVSTLFPVFRFKRISVVYHTRAFTGPKAAARKALKMRRELRHVELKPRSL